MNIVELNQSPRLVVIHDSTKDSPGLASALRLLISQEPFTAATVEYLSMASPSLNRANLLAVPDYWAQNIPADDNRIVRYTDRFPLSPVILQKLRPNGWLIVSNGRFVSTIGKQRLAEVLSQVDAQVISIEVAPALALNREVVSCTSMGHVAGFSRGYSNSIKPTLMPVNWPGHLLIKAPVAKAAAASGGLAADFSDFIRWCRRRGFTMRSAQVGGAVLDLEKETDLLGVLRRLARFNVGCLNLDNNSLHNRRSFKCSVSSKARLFGNILCGKRVKVKDHAVLSGPLIIGDDVSVGIGSVVRNAAIGSGLVIPDGMIIENKVIEFQEQLSASGINGKANVTAVLPSCMISFEKQARPRFRIWPLLSYPRLIKRLFDIVVAIIVLALFAPFALLVALAVKLSSKGPVIFEARRQGLHGNEFNCFKFRTMISDADVLQEHLRDMNQVEGPQFSIKNDPRTSAVGKFLRDTFIDEIPQFINVLTGQMSVVGPRPSPESENTQCARWRDARLSVRPGITGLWQVCRTRAWGRDFQEWIRYDIAYVHKISFKMDMWICWRTLLKILFGFIRQFKKK